MAAYIALKDAKGAMDAAAALVAKHPDSASAYGTRGYLYVELGNDDKAIADFAKALSLDPNNEMALANRGIIRVRQRTMPLPRAISMRRPR